VRDTLESLESVWVKTLVRRSDKLLALMPQLYVKGLSTRAIESWWRKRREESAP
jgi:hypothetical protein